MLARGGRLDVADGRADHESGEGAGALLARIAIADLAAEPQDGRPVAQTAHLLELVRDVEKRAPLRLQPLQGLEKAGGLLRGQNGGGLVQNDQLGVLQQAAGDLDALALARAERPDLPVGLQRHVVAGGDRVDGLAQAREGLPLWQDEGDVLRHGQIVEEGEMLEHHAHAQRPCLLRALQAHRLAREGDDASGGLQQAIDDLDQRGLARPIFADEPMGLACANVEADVVIGGEGAESLHDPAQRQQRRRLHLLLAEHET